MTTVILFVGEAPDDQVEALKRMATEINTTAEDRLRERQEVARALVESYRNRPARRARPSAPPQPVPVTPAYREELAAFAPPDWRGVILEYPVMPDEQPPTMWNGINTICNGAWT